MRRDRQPHVDLILADLRRRGAFITCVTRGHRIRIDMHLGGKHCHVDVPRDTSDPIRCASKIAAGVVARHGLQGAAL